MNARKRILLVEDDAKFRFVLQFVLEQRGYHIKSCENAEEARRHDADIVDFAIIDVRLPLEQGTDLARHLMREHSHIKVIFMTAYDDVETLDGILSGASLMVKPIELEALCRLLL